MMEISITTRMWHGLTEEEWIALWDRSAWRDDLKQSLLDIVGSRAPFEQRLGAFQLLEHAINMGLIAPDTSLPYRLQRLLKSAVTGAKFWWWRRAARERAVVDKLSAVQSTLRIADTLFTGAREARARQLTSAKNADAGMLS